MSSPRSLQQATSLWIDRSADRKSSRIAASMTCSLLLAMGVAGFLPRSLPTIPMPVGALPLTMEFRHMPSSVAVQAAPQETRKLLAEDPLPESLLIPEPSVPEEIVKPPEPVTISEPKPEPKPEPKTKPKPKPKPETKPVKKTPPKSAPKKAQAPVKEQPVQHAASIGETTTALSTEPAKAAPLGHAEGGQNRNQNGEILAVLLHAVEANKKYPKQARRQGAEGQVMLKISINAQGVVTGFDLVKECGHSALDGAARTLGGKLVGLKIPPAKGSPVQVLIPVKYTLS